jgi:hypothetical protein
MPQRKSNVQPRLEAEFSHEKTQAHLRRTKEQIKEQWLLGDYTPAGYLYNLLAAMKAEGLPVTVSSIKEFCAEWEIDKRQFYRAKARLIDQNRLSEEIHGSVSLTLKSPRKECDKSVTACDKSVTPGDKSVTPGDKSVTPGDNFVTPTPLNPNQEAGSGDSPDLYRSYRSIQIPPDLIFSGTNPENPRENALARLKVKWSMPGQKRAAIAEAKQWGFKIDKDGISESEEPIE